MKQINVSSVQAHFGRKKFAHSPAGASATRQNSPDPRWYALDLVRVARLRLNLRDRDIAVLRGLLSLLPTAAWGKQMVVFASNRVLAARCDGIEERTLRRRLGHLVNCGLIARKSSPNGKRYQVKDQDDARLVAYGIDLTPLWTILGHLEALAADCQREELRARALKSLIRDRLYHHPELGTLPLAETARRALRRNLTGEALQRMLDQIDQTIAASQPVLSECADAAPCPVDPAQITAELTGTDSQNVRHIQSSDKEDLESERPVEVCVDLQPLRTSDITVAECMEAATTSRTMSPTVPRTWPEVARLAKVLGPAIGLDRRLIETAEAKLGQYGSALAVLGLVEAFGRIRNPEAYLNALIKKAAGCGLDYVRMFLSLAKPKLGFLA
ncbi:MAG: plasmid replication protein RepC [Cypionkella sp.]